MNRRITRSLLVVVAVSSSAAGACGVLTSAPSDHSSASSPAAATAPQPDLAPTQPAGDLLAQLVVAPEDTGAHYDRGDWPHWSSHDGCTTRELVLKREALAYRKGQAINYTKCDAVGNAYWVSHYDNATVRDPRDLQIDHVVPLAEANRSGARNWPREQREQFANDMSQLIAVTDESNQPGCHSTERGRVCGKGDDDPGRWMPPNRGFWCEYATAYTATKVKYHLTADQREHDALARVLTTCH